MKLRKFSTQANEVIQTVCAIDPNQSAELNISIIEKAIGKFDKELRAELKERQRADKVWRLKRQELGLFYTFIMSTTTIHEKKATKDWKKLHDCFLKLASVERLTHPFIVQAACDSGLLRLTSEEVESLIKNNIEV